MTIHYLYTIHQCGRRPCIVGKTLGTQAKFEVLRSDYTRNFATYSRNRTNIKTTSTDAMSYATRPRVSRIETSAANVVANSTNIKRIAKNQRCGCVSWRYHAWETFPLIAINLKSRNCTNIKTTSTDLHTWAHHRRCITTTNIRIKLNMVRVRTRKTYLRSGCTIVFYKGITVEQRVCVHTYLCIC